jgi:hypothetical protein
VSLKKINLKKLQKIDSSQPELTQQIRDTGHKTMVTQYKG